MTPSLRLFIAIELPAEVRAALAAAQRSLQSRGRGLRWVDPDGAHLTLKFLGETAADRVEAITTALATAAAAAHPFTLHTAGLGAFPGTKAPRVVWLGVSGELDRLRRLASDVERLVAPLGFPSEARGFSPHLTLARTARDLTGAERAALGVAVAESVAPASVAWQVTAVSLMRSTLGPGGARYCRIVSVSLDAPNAPVIIPPGTPDSPPRA